jgi:hypothetical protein
MSSQIGAYLETFYQKYDKLIQIRSNIRFKKYTNFENSFAASSMFNDSFPVEPASLNTLLRESCEENIF